MIDWPQYRYRAVVRRVVDGDTLHVDVDLGMRTFRRTSLRIAGIDAPEINRGTEASRAAGDAARLDLEELLPVGTDIYVRTYKDRKTFDRYEADVYRENNGELEDVAALMVAAGHAMRSEG